MYEKYDAFVIGSGGDGGEYTPQVGFGWSNGVALVLLNATSRSNISDDDDELSLRDRLYGGLTIVGVVLVTIGFLLGLATIVYVGTKLFYFVTDSASGKPSSRHNYNREASPSPTNSPFKEQL